MTRPIAIAALCALALPASAGAAKGGGSAPAGPCVPVASLNNGAVDKPASRKRVTVDLQVTNCGTTTTTFGSRLVGATQSLRSTDPYVVEQCPTAPYAGQTVSLRPGESKSISVNALVGYCDGSPWGTSPWGIDLTYTVEYAVFVVDSATGAVAGTTTSTVLHRGGD